MSGTSDNVAIISNQKKNEYLKSSKTIEFSTISTANNTSDRIIPAKKYGSAFLLNAHSLISSCH